MTPTRDTSPLTTRRDRRTPSRSRRGGALKIGVITVALAGVVGAGYLALASGTTAGESTATTSELVRAERTAFDITTVATGDLEARHRLEIRSEVEGQTTILWIVPEGSRVQQGDLIVRLNGEEIQNEIDTEMERLTSAQNDVASAETSLSLQLSDNETSLRDAELEVRLAELDLQKYLEADDKKRREELRINIENGRVQLERLRNKFEQSQALFDQGFLSADEFELDRIELNKSESDLLIAELELETYVSYEFLRQTEQLRSAVDKAKAKLNRVREQNEINRRNQEVNLSSKRRLLEQREQRIAKLEAQIAACEIYAPRSGLVVYASSIDRDNWRNQQEGPIAVGRNLRSNDLIMALPDTSEMMASVKVHESLAGRLRPGQAATVKIEAAGGLTLPATVDSIGILAEGGGWRDPNRREYTVKLAINAAGAGDRIKPSMRCEARIVLGAVENTLAVPVQAVFNDGPVTYIYQPDGSRYQRVPVAVGRRSDTYAEITAGIEENDRVLLREPSPGEVIGTPWDAGKLQLAGFSLDENGKPTRARPMGMPGQRPGGAPDASGDDQTEAQADEQPNGQADAQPVTQPVTGSETRARRGRPESSAG